MKVRSEDVEELTGEAAKKLLAEIVKNLDELDEEDFFGSEGWRHYLGLED